MKVVVLGAGVIGVTTAWYLARAGAEVRVLDRQPGPGLETSFANAGELSYGMTSPWAAPGIPMKAVKWLFMRHRPLFIWPMVDPAMWAWGARMLANCNDASYRINKGRMVRISNYSRDALTDLMAEVPLEFDQREAGTLQLFRTEKQVKASAADQEVLAEYGSPYAMLDRDECIAVEPGLRHVADKFVGGLRLLADRTGDCRMFTLALAARTEALGASFQYGVTIKSIERAGDRIVGVETDHGRETADAYVCALGPYAPILLKSVGIRLPIYPIKGYSITLPVTDPDCGAGLDADGRDAQGGDHPARRADPGGGPGRDHRLQRQARQERHGHGPLRGGRSVPQGRRRQQGRGLDRAAADDARRHAGDRADARTRTCGSTPDMARSAGRCPPDRGARWPTLCWAGRLKSASTA